MVILLPSGIARAQEMNDAGEPGQQKSRWGLGQSEDPDLRAVEAHFYLPYYQREDLSLAVGARTRRFDFRTAPTGGAFATPESLEDREFLLTAAYRQDEKTRWSLGVNYGSASDRPFDGGDVSVLGVTLSHRAPISETSDWIWFLNYSNNRVILNNVPLPGFAATFRDQDKTWGGMWGFPFLMLWSRPTPKTFASAFLLFPAAVRIQGGYLVWGPVQLTAKTEYQQQAFLISGRPRREERLFLESAKALLGLKAFLGQGTFFEFEAGRAFGRSLFRGRSSFDREPGNVEIPDENLWSAGLQLTL